MRTKASWAWLLLLIAAALPFAACRKDSEASKHRQLEGRVTNIDTETGVVEMSWFNEKQKKEITLSGKLAPEAEILINGATATLADIRTDDKVTVIGHEEKRDGDRQLVATQVRVTRAESSTKPAAATAPNK